MNNIIISKEQFQLALDSTAKKSFEAGYNAAVKQLQYQAFITNELPPIISQAKVSLTLMKA